MKKVIIVGGGFAGLNLAKHLSRKKQFEVTLVDKNNYHFFTPFTLSGFNGFYRTF